MRKGISPFVSAAIYTGLIIATIVLVVQVAMPIIEKMKDVAAVDQAKDMLTVLNKYIQDVASEGKGSTRLVQIQTKRGTLAVVNESDKIEFAIDTAAAIVSPRTKQRIGVLTLAANCEVDVRSNDTHYMMENSHLNLSFLRYDKNDSNPHLINISNLTTMFYLEDESAHFDGVIDLEIDGKSVINGTGYTEVSETGSDLPTGVFIAHINSTSQSIGYDLYFTLESEGDYLTVEVQNYRTL